MTELTAAVDIYSYDCSPAYYRNNVDTPAEALPWIDQLEIMYWNRPDLTEMDRWVLSNVFSLVIGNWDAFSRPENKRIPVEIKDEMNRRVEAEHKAWNKWPVQKLNRIWRKKPLTYPGEIERGLPGTKSLGPMVLIGSSTHDVASQWKPDPTPHPVDTLENLPTDYDYCEFECSPKYYKENVPMTCTAAEWVGEIERLYWNCPDLSRVTRWILRNIFSCGITRKTPNDVATLVKRGGSKEMMQRCIAEHPEWMRGAKHMMKMIMQ